MSALDTTITAVSAAGGLGVLTGLAAAVRRASRKVGQFLDDWNGEAARSGVPARLGVMARLQATDRKLDRVIEHQAVTDTRLGELAAVVGRSVIIPTPERNGVTVTTHVGEST